MKVMFVLYVILHLSFFLNPVAIFYINLLWYVRVMYLLPMSVRIFCILVLSFFCFLLFIRVSMIWGFLSDIFNKLSVIIRRFKCMLRSRSWNGCCLFMLCGIDVLHITMKVTVGFSVCTASVFLACFCNSDVKKVYSCFLLSGAKFCFG